MSDADKKTVEVQTGHVGINVTDLKRSVEFYSNVFGLQILRKSEGEGRRFAFLGTEQKTVLTLWEQGKGRFNNATPGLHHLSFRVEDIASVRELERRVREAGARLLYSGVVPHSEGSDSGGIFFEDPDGTRLEVFSPTGAASQTAPVAGAPSCGFF
jgi:lactoylglutathione lyase